MSRLITGFQVLFLTFAFIIVIRAQESPMNRCMEMIDADEQFNSIIQLGSEEQLDEFCTDFSKFIRCTNEVLQEQTGFNLKELAILMKGTDIGKVLSILVNIEELIVEICSEGTQLHEDYLENAECFRNIDDNIPEECEQQAKDAYESFMGLEGRSIEQDPLNEPCVAAAYQLGCLGAAIHENCGDRGFNTYKEIVKKIGFFKSGLCSSQIIQSIKTSFVDNLNISETRKSMYRVIFDLKKRRK